MANATKRNYRPPRSRAFRQARRRTGGIRRVRRRCSTGSTRARLGIYPRSQSTRIGTATAVGFTPLAGKTALDVGCGAGLLCEPLARLGAKVTGLDAAAENIGAARAHAAQRGLTIDYRAGGIEAFAGRGASISSRRWK